MASPVTIPFESIIQIDRGSSTPVYLQIAHQIINAIQRQYLPAGTRLPGSRQLATALRVHRNTIIMACQELDAQGWLEIHPNKGSFIIGKVDPKPTKFQSGITSRLVHYPLQTGFYFRKSNLLDNPMEAGNTRLVLNDGLPDYRLLPLDQLGRYYSASLKRKMNRRHLGYHISESNLFFRKQLANYLNLTRGLHISPDNILLTRGTEMSLFITASLLLQPVDTVVVGTPGYYSMNMIFQQAGARIKTVPVDAEGIDTLAVRKLCEKQAVRLVYLTPHHHYPTTVPLSAGRRIELLNMATEFGFVILEDDFDYDFQYDKSPVLPLASADTGGMVVYCGSFGKLLAPGFRTGFVIAPENLIAELRKHLQVVDRQGDPLLEQVLGELIEEGEMHRLLKKSLPIYKERRNRTVDLLKAALAEQLSFEAPGGGLAIWLKWKNALNLGQFSKACEARDLFIPRTLLYQQKNLTAMRMGFGHLEDAELRDVVQIMQEVMITQ
ncbi:PLP-dependent aminotransferase family protein [Flavihumibacter sp. CACIAM 22H1]|uniref:aminotransferase-like domain-containing protein n=1 Tax=Flavihumibacter sp. CACIAM 22H1 TaxID=1812911 RepID=UPI0007A877D0|nr:PLP-dependent aminotransferase family protein [Flavihumibacter sp. CACIAM 22H1]KYP14641.1 MAG: GntR family transcriptional regulator [Flavihumibacter sp. CACIAM 22H1]